MKSCLIRGCNKEAHTCLGQGGVPVWFCDNHRPREEHYVRELPNEIAGERTHITGQNFRPERGDYVNEPQLLSNETAKRFSESEFCPRMTDEETRALRNGLVGFIYNSLIKFGCDEAGTPERTRAEYWKNRSKKLESTIEELRRENETLSGRLSYAQRVIEERIVLNTKKKA